MTHKTFFTVRIICTFTILSRNSCIVTGRTRYTRKRSKKENTQKNRSTKETSFGINKNLQNFNTPNQNILVGQIYDVDYQRHPQFNSPPQTRKQHEQVPGFASVLQVLSVQQYWPTRHSSLSESSAHLQFCPVMTVSSLVAHATPENAQKRKYIETFGVPNESDVESPKKSNLLKPQIVFCKNKSISRVSSKLPPPPSGDFRKIEGGGVFWRPPLFPKKRKVKIFPLRGNEGCAFWK